MKGVKAPKSYGDLKVQEEHVAIIEGVSFIVL